MWQAGQRRQQDSFKQQDRANIQIEGLARHKQIEAQVQERNSRIEIDRARQQEREAQQHLAKQRRWLQQQSQQQAQQKKRAKRSGLIPLQHDVNVIDISLDSPCLLIPCLANSCLAHQA